MRPDAVITVVVSNFALHFDVLQIQQFGDHALCLSTSRDSREGQNCTRPRQAKPGLMRQLSLEFHEFEIIRRLLFVAGFKERLDSGENRTCLTDASLRGPRELLAP